MSLGLPASIVLAGGRGERLGGADKPSLDVGGRSLLEGVLEAVEFTVPIVVVGPLQPRPGVIVAQESPPFGGPLAGIDAGLRLITGAATVVVMACDLPRAQELVQLVLAHAIPEDSDGVIVVDSSGRRQWLAGHYRVAQLRSAIAAVREERPDGVHGATMRSALGRLVLTEVEDSTGVSRDVDTPSDLEQARRSAAEGGTDE